MNKKGIILPGVLVLISVLVLLAVTRHFFSRQQMHFSALLAEKEQAYHIAVGLREIAVKQINRAIEFYNSSDPETFPKLEKSDATTRPLLEKLLSGTNEPSGKAFKLSLTSESAEEYLTMIRKNGVEPSAAETIISFTPEKPLFENSGRGIVPDPAEIFWKLIIRCRVRVDRSEATAVWYKQGRTISIQPSIPGKFSFFVLEPEPDKLNLPLSESSLPLVINNGNITSAESINPPESGEFIDRQGWVYLGENAEITMRLNRQAPFLNGNFFISPVDSSDYLATLGTFAWYYYCDGFDKSLKTSPDGISPFAEFAENQILPTSSVLFNGSKDSPSPTLVIGRVLRSYPIIQGLTGRKSGKRFPFPAISGETFNGTSWPCRLKAAEAEMIKRNFSNDYQKYSQRMSFIYHEPFNAANLQSLKLGKLHREYAILQPSALPAETGSLPVSRRLQANSAPAGFFDFVSATTFSLTDENGRQILREASFASMSDPEFLRQRASLVCSNFKELVNKISGADKTLKFPGAALVKDDVDINSPMQISDAGGLLLVNGNVTVSAPVTVSKGALFTIVSLGGNISVSDKISVDSGLICLSGLLQIGRGSKINGGIACKRFSADLSGPVAAEIRYHKAADPTDSKAVRASYRLSPDEKEYYFVE